MEEQTENKYTFELKDLSYNDLMNVYNNMITFVKFLKKEEETAEIEKDSGKGN
jgi:hypothetical protein